jgi:hypothetical protein
MAEMRAGPTPTIIISLAPTPFSSSPGVEGYYLGPQVDLGYGGIAVLDDKSLINYGSSARR